MATIRFKATCEEGHLFVEKIRNGRIQKDIPLNYGKTFADGEEKLASMQFYNFLNSMSYVMALNRKYQ